MNEMIEMFVLYLACQWIVGAFVWHRLNNPLSQALKELKNGK